MGEGSRKGKKAKTNHEISWFASLHTGWGVCPPHRRCVIPPPPPPPRLAPAACHLTPPLCHPSSSSSCRPPDSPVANVVASDLVIFWVSAVFLPPRTLRRSRLTRPHPIGKGRGGWGCNLACEGPEAVLMKPTSLNRGEGLVYVLICDVRGVEGEGEGEDGGGGGRRE